MKHIISTQQGYLPIEFDLEFDRINETVSPINITFEGRPIELNQKQTDALLDYINENLESIMYNENESLT